MRVVQILSRDEIVAVLADLQRRAKRRVPNTWQNLIIFRLSCCCGLRRVEIAGLNLADIVTTGNRPCIRIRKEITKGRENKRRARLVPLWWDSGTLNDIAKWKEHRVKFGARPSDPFVCSMKSPTTGERLAPKNISRRWRTAIRCLEPERVRQLHVHCGRHSFCSHALESGRSLPEVRDAAGHRSIATTEIYLHTIERRNLPDIFNFSLKETQ